MDFPHNYSNLEELKSNSFNLSEFNKIMTNIINFLKLLNKKNYFHLNPSKKLIIFFKQILFFYYKMLISNIKKLQIN